MIGKYKDKIKKTYSTIKTNHLTSRQCSNRLIIDKAKWFNNADSPVMLMIDDLTNAWHSRNGNSSWDYGGDWGGGLLGEKSVFSFLFENLLNDFPEVKVTLFVVAGKISHYTHGYPFTFAEALNFSEESKAFFRKVNDDDRFEIAYHGYNHGTPGKRTEDFIQEWKGVHSVEEACRQTEKGMEIFKEVFDKYPSGGKYGGWEYNQCSDESVDRTGFLWWCRDWMPSLQERPGDARRSLWQRCMFPTTKPPSARSRTAITVSGSSKATLPARITGFLPDRNQPMRRRAR